MDFQEKLVELLKTSPKRDGCIYIEDLSDHLIANGVTVQKQGEWVYDHWCEFRCSVCGEFSNSKPYRGKENYCPNCGAKMNGGQNNETY